MRNRKACFGNDNLIHQISNRNVVAGSPGNGKPAGASGGVIDAPDTARAEAGAPGIDGGNVGTDTGDMPCPVVTDVIIQPVSVVEGPASLRRLVLAMYLDNGDLLVYEARMSSAVGEKMATKSFGGSTREKVQRQADPSTLFTLNRAIISAEVEAGTG